MGFLDSKIKNLENGRQVLAMPNSVNFLILTQDKYLILSSQKRAGNNELETLNCFGGYIEKEDETKTIEYTVFKELKEETNLTVNEIKEIIPIYKNKLLSVGYTTEASSLFILKTNKNLNELELRCNDENENINIIVNKANLKYVLKLKEETNCLKFYLALEYLYNYRFSLLNE